MTPEGKVKEKVKKLLNELHVYYHMPVQNGMGKPSLDFICCAGGRFIAIETKTEKSTLTLRQKATIDEMHKAGASVWVIYGLGDEVTLTLLRAALEESK